jgi:hypothetical protein
LSEAAPFGATDGAGAAGFEQKALFSVTSGRALVLVISVLANFITIIKF